MRAKIFFKKKTCSFFPLSPPRIAIRLIKVIATKYTFIQAPDSFHVRLNIPPDLRTYTMPTKKESYTTYFAYGRTYYPCSSTLSPNRSMRILKAAVRAKTNIIVRIRPIIVEIRIPHAGIRIVIPIPAREHGEVQTYIFVVRPLLPPVIISDLFYPSSNHFTQFVIKTRDRAETMSFKLSSRKLTDCPIFKLEITELISQIKLHT